METGKRDIAKRIAVDMARIADLRKLPSRARRFLALLLSGQIWRWPESPHNDRQLAKAKIDYENKIRGKLGDFLRQSISVRFPSSRQKPDVSVLVVCWNKAEHTLQCLLSLHAQRGVKLEIIVIDNGSTDSTPGMLKLFDGIKVIPLAENIGFLRGINLAASHATGRSLLLLNNDATLRDGAIGAALKTLESSDDIGAVGGKMVLPDGRLQEAGSIIWSNGVCKGYVQGAPADCPEASFRREVDYCSGAFLLVRRALFDELQGFDERFAPAYYEETDLCMRIRSAGYRVMYEPEAVVDHFEFASSGVKDKIKSGLEKNRLAFVEKHGAILVDHYPPDPKLALWARSRTGTSRHLILVDAAKATFLSQASADVFVTVFSLEAAHHASPSLSPQVCGATELVQGNKQALLRFLIARAGYYDSIELEGDAAKRTYSQLSKLVRFIY
jgi:O-antigen biosynthesis protein